MELKKCVKELGDMVDKFHSATSKLKAEHNLLELCHLHYSQFWLQFLALNKLWEANGKPALSELEMEVFFTDMYIGLECDVVNLACGSLVLIACMINEFMIYPVSTSPL